MLTLYDYSNENERNQKTKEKDNIRNTNFIDQDNINYITEYRHIMDKG